MKITKQYLRKIIIEEVSKVIKEQNLGGTGSPGGSTQAPKRQASPAGVDKAVGPVKPSNQGQDDYVARLKQSGAVEALNLSQLGPAGTKISDSGSYSSNVVTLENKGKAVATIIVTTGIRGHMPFGSWLLEAHEVEGTLIGKKISIGNAHLGNRTLVVANILIHK